MKVDGTLPDVNSSVAWRRHHQVLVGVKPEGIDGPSVACVLKQGLARVHAPNNGSVVGRGGPDDGMTNPRHTDFPNAVAMTRVPGKNTIGVVVGIFIFNIFLVAAVVGRQYRFVRLKRQKAWVFPNAFLEF